MRALVTVYECRGCFLLHPSGLRLRGPWVAQEPGLGVSTSATDEVLGQLVLLASQCSSPLPIGTPVDQGHRFPLQSLAGLKSWAGLARAAGMSLSVEFDGEIVKIRRSLQEGGAFSGDSAFVPIQVSSAVTPRELGHHVRRSLLGEA